MADRKSLFSRFWPASASRRTPETQTTVPPPATPPPPSPNRRPRATTQPATPASAPPLTPSHHPTPTTQPATPASAPPPTPSHHPTPTTQPATDHQTAEQPSNTISEPRKSPSTKTQTSITSTNPIDEPKTTSPSRESTQSSSPSKPESPNRRVAKSRSPPQPSSPAPQAQRTGSQTTKRPSISRLNSPSPKAGSSSSPKRTLPKSPSKGPRQPTQEISSKEKDQKPAASQQEPQLNTEVETNSPNDFTGKNLDEKSFKNDEVHSTPSQSSKIGTINGEHEPLVGLTANRKEVVDVKEVVQETSHEANEELKKEKSGSEYRIIEKTKVLSKPLSSGSKDQIIEKTKITSKPLSSGSGDQIEKMALHSKPLSSSSEDQIIEKTTIPSKPDQVQREEKEPCQKKETLGVTPGNTKNSQPKVIRSTISNTHNKHALSNGEHAPLQQNIKDNITFANQMAIGDTKGIISDKPVSVITLAGENRGASMQMESNSSNRDGAVHIHRNYKTNPEESAEATTDGEGISDRKKSKDANSTDDQTTETYVNNNSQGINNSIVFNSSFTEGNPGVHMVFTHLPKEPIQSTNTANFPEIRKAEFNTTHLEKLSHQPTVRRRCLKGLFLETSDSDLEDPEKPRRHGCRVGCEKRDKENKTYVP